MPARRIRLLGDPVLRRVSEPVEDPARVIALLADLRDTLHQFRRDHGFGRGISAVQVGEPVRVIYLEFEGQPYCLLNPQYDWQSPASFRLWDDCFSFPNLMVQLERHEAVRVRYRDERGQDQVLEASGPLSELLQHEIDHLDGVLAVDRALDANSLCLREEWERQGRP